MVHCPECGTTFEDVSDVEFEDVDSSFGFLTAPKRFYVASCASCGWTIGSGVAAASSDGAAAAGGAAH